MVAVAQCRVAAEGDWLAPEASTCNYGARDTASATPIIVTTRDW